MMGDFDLQAWVKELELSDDERKLLEPILAKEQNQKKLKESFLRQSDYSKHMNKLSDKEKELEGKIQTRMQEIEAYEQGLVSWKGNAEATVQKKEAEAEKLSKELEKTRTAMAKIQEEYGVDPGQYLKDVTNPPVIDEKVLGKYVDRDSFEKAVKDAMQFPDVAAEMMDLNAEHFELYGQPLKNHRKLVAQAIKDKKSLRDVWADQYKVEEKRQEIAKKAHDEEIERVRQETEARVRSELKIPAQRPNAARPIVLSDAMKSRQPQTGHKADSDTIDAAMSAYSSGKYAEGSGQ